MKYIWVGNEARISYGKDVDVMKRKIYRIKLWIDKINFCKWDVYAKDNMEAQSICEHLKECCVKNGGWTPVMAEIKCLLKSQSITGYQSGR